MARTEAPPAADSSGQQAKAVSVQETHYATSFRKSKKAIDRLVVLDYWRRVTCLAERHLGVDGRVQRKRRVHACCPPSTAVLAWEAHAHAA